MLVVEVETFIALELRVQVALAVEVLDQIQLLELRELRTEVEGVEQEQVLAQQAVLALFT
jgi:hypothetical protein